MAAQVLPLKEMLLLSRKPQPDGYPAGSSMVPCQKHTVLQFHPVPIGLHTALQAVKMLCEEPDFIILNHAQHAVAQCQRHNMLQLHAVPIWVGTAL